jgi:hypothetical protein
MKNVNIFFIDGTEYTITDKMINNFDQLLEWLRSNSDVPFETMSNTRTRRVLYKKNIKYVDLFG